MACQLTRILSYCQVNVCGYKTFVIHLLQSLMSSLFSLFATAMLQQNVLKLSEMYLKSRLQSNDFRLIQNVCCNFGI